MLRLRRWTVTIVVSGMTWRNEEAALVAPVASSHQRVLPASARIVVTCAVISARSVLAASCDRGGSAWPSRRCQVCAACPHSAMIPVPAVAATAGSTARASTTRAAPAYAQAKTMTGPVRMPGGADSPGSWAPEPADGAGPGGTAAGPLTGGPAAGGGLATGWLRCRWSLPCRQAQQLAEDGDAAVGCPGRGLAVVAVAQLAGPDRDAQVNLAPEDLLPHLQRGDHIPVRALLRVPGHGGHCCRGQVNQPVLGLVRGVPGDHHGDERLAAVPVPPLRAGGRQAGSQLPAQQLRPERPVNDHDRLPGRAPCQGLLRSRPGRLCADRGRLVWRVRGRGLLRGRPGSLCGL